jgi:endoglucanase
MKAMKKRFTAIILTCAMLLSIMTPVQSTGASAYSVDDAITILKHVVGLEMVTDLALFYALDVDGDEELTVDDAITILKGVVDLIPMPPRRVWETPTTPTVTTDSESWPTTSDSTDSSQDSAVTTPYSTDTSDIPTISSTEPGDSDTITTTPSYVVQINCNNCGIPVPVGGLCWTCQNITSTSATSSDEPIITTSATSSDEPINTTSGDEPIITTSATSGDEPIITTSSNEPIITTESSSSPTEITSITSTPTEITSTPSESSVTTTTPIAGRHVITFNHNYAGPANLTVSANGLGRINSADFPAAPTRTGFTFVGWFTVAADSGGEQIRPGSSDGTLFTADTTVWARWDALPAVGGTPRVIYNMQNDSSIHLFNGPGFAAEDQSVHPVLGSNGGARTANVVGSPRSIAITGRTGTSQGVDIILSALNTRPNHNYRFEFAGKAASSGTMSFLVVGGDTLATTNTTATGDFTLAFDTNHNAIAAHAATAGARYRLGGVSAVDLTVTGIIITAFCPSGCACEPVVPGPVTHTPFRNVTSNVLVGEIGIGWNLGNTLDAYNSPNPAAVLISASNDYNSPVRIETSWLGGIANRTTQALISDVRARGFNAIRIPVTWYKAMQNPGASSPTAADYSIDARWLHHVQTVVDMAVREDMYIILNTHHDDFIFRLNTPGERTRGELAVTEAWRQIATHFRDYNEKLIFEGLNEPKHRLVAWNTDTSVNNSHDWTGTEYTRETVNMFNQAFVNAVRATGGNNERRHLMLPTYGAQGTARGQLEAFRLPSDPITANGTSKFILSIHIYSPHDWAHDGVGSYSGVAAIQTDLNRVATRAHQLGIPVILGEWGTLAQHSSTSRATHAYDFVRTATDIGTRSSNPVVMRTFVWDTGRRNDDGTARGYLLFDRQPPFIRGNNQNIITAMVAGREQRSRP